MTTLGLIFMHIGFIAWFCVGYAIGNNQSLRRALKQKQKREPQLTAVQWLQQISQQRELDKFDMERALQMEKELLTEAYIQGAQMGQLIITQRLKDDMQQDSSNTQ